METAQTTAAAVLDNSEDIIATFHNLPAQLARIDAFREAVVEVAEDVANIVIVDADSRDKAQELARVSKGILSRIEDGRQEIKKPYFEAGKLVDKTAKSLSDSLEKADAILRSKIKTYDLEVEAKKRAELERIERERREREAAENKERERVAQLRGLITAAERSFTIEISRAEKISTLNEIVQRLEDVKKNAHKFQEFEPEVTALVDRLIGDAIARFDAVDEMEKAGEARRAEMKAAEEKRLAEVERVRAEREAAELQARREAEAQAELNREIDDAKSYVETKAVESQNKTSLAKSWKFEVTNEFDVPRLFLMVNERAIKDAIKAGVREIAGVRIFEDVTVVIR